MNAELKS